MGDDNSHDYTTSENEFWIFGYGEDHRGTPTSPGRVVTLIPYTHWLTLPDPHPISTSSNSLPKVWGTAYRIPPSKVSEVRAYLDIREINGYTIHYTPFYPSSKNGPNAPSNNDTENPTIRTLLYIGTPDNAQFTGPQEPQQLAEHIWKSEGPSGLNRDYLLSLDIALDELSPESGDEHVKDLADRVRKIAERQVGVEAEARHIKVIDHELKRIVTSTAEQEETRLISNT
ncbi:hypothetical protein DSL72_003654 [Monilinia vaccinii-corymbosi]|uniref:glutathione-specific gamma-glutamylcyclotransferase n=1 Tax=Monilinia vaccinii-corymbosi TaxID=61207 RepID=A0A8A3NUK9_9HELO|nr:hypothetical protein DSL72_003654 [Monilinia vaccinii-corymbosi]